MIDKKPLVSVIMPVHNSAAYLNKAINSVLNQTYKNLELIIIDDSSVDNSLKIINSFKDSRISVYTLDENHGNYYCRNIGIDKSKGKYIANMDSDDISLPNRIEKQVNFFEKNPSIYILGTCIFTINEDGMLLQKLVSETDSERIKIKSLFYMEFFNPTIMFRKELFCEHKYRYDGNRKFAQDYALLSELVMRFDSSNLPDFLLEYRINSNQISQKNKIQQTEYYLDAIQARFDFIGIKIDKERRHLIKIITRNHDNIPLKLKDLIRLKELFNELVNKNKKIKLLNSYKLIKILRQLYLDTFHQFQGSYLSYLQIYFKIEIFIFSTFSFIGLLKLMKRGVYSFKK
jgi:glycosyltransferase involved in cell wall biosynthesis